MNRIYLPCPVKDCTGLRHDAFFCARHWNLIKHEDQKYFAHYSRIGDFDIVRRFTDVMVEILADEADHPTPLTGVV